MTAVLSFAVFVALVVGAAWTGARFRPGAWYRALDKPGWTPPDLVFPVVWGVLYVAIAAAGWLVWRADGWSLSLALWGVQLVLNAAWSWLFFGLRRMRLAFIDIALLWLAIASFIAAAWPVSMTSALLFLPYLAWVSLAAALNLSIMHRNPSLDGGR